ncbi:hypothetical protein QBC36DRAFT_314821 [Triangularia setosa]|uniref:Uncharacterized protein n=1 Tax=Triangularia setosa TaxID=2587417 RepID=A0AAN6VZ41_9PEZI|nr:hypothetical protein QBC36DRAFT_314821 [Podospora setosa]
MATLVSPAAQGFSGDEFGGPPPWPSSLADLDHLTDTSACESEDELEDELEDQSENKPAKAIVSKQKPAQPTKRKRRFRCILCPPKRDPATGQLKWRTFLKKPNLRRHLVEFHNRPHSSTKETWKRVGRRRVERRAKKLTRKSNAVQTGRGPGAHPKMGVEHQQVGSTGQQPVRMERRQRMVMGPWRHQSFLEAQGLPVLGTQQLRNSCSYRPAQHPSTRQGQSDPAPGSVPNDMPGNQDYPLNEAYPVSAIQQDVSGEVQQGSHAEIPRYHGPNRCRSVHQNSQRHALPSVQQPLNSAPSQRALFDDQQQPLPSSPQYPYGLSRSPFEAQLYAPPQSGIRGYGNSQIGRNPRHSNYPQMQGLNEAHNHQYQQHDLYGGGVDLAGIINPSNLASLVPNQPMSGSDAAVSAMPGRRHRQESWLPQPEDSGNPLSIIDPRLLTWPMSSQNRVPNQENAAATVPSASHGQNRGSVAQGMNPPYPAAPTPINYNEDSGMSPEYPQGWNEGEDTRTDSEDAEYEIDKEGQ